MANKIQVRRGTKPYLPTLSAGEFGLAQDTEELFIGGPNGNIEIARKSQIDAINTSLEEKKTILSGTTPERPTTGLVVGMDYYDTDLGKPIYLHQIDPIIWHDATGTVV